MKQLLHKIDLLHLLAFIVMLFVALWLFAPARAQDVTPEVTAPPDGSITIDNPETVNIESPPSAESNYAQLIGAVFGVGIIVISLAITFASAVNNKSKEETTKDLMLRLEKSVPFEVVMALLGAGVKLTETKIDDEGLEKLKSTLGVTKAQEPTNTP